MPSKSTVRHPINALTSRYTRLMGSETSAAEW
jgi:hypothetical protein